MILIAWLVALFIALLLTLDLVWSLAVLAAAVLEMKTRARDPCTPLAATTAAAERPQVKGTWSG